MNTEDAAKFIPNDWERQVLTACAAGEWAVLELNEQGEPPVLRADFLEILLLRQRDDWAIHPRGVRIGADTEQDHIARVTGALELNGVDADQRLPLFYIRNVTFEKQLLLRQASLNEVNFSDCSFPEGADFSSAHIQGALFLRNIKIDGSTLILANATITNQLSLEDAKLSKANDYALNAFGVNISGSVFMDRIDVEGYVAFIGAAIGGMLTFYDAKLRNPHSVVLNCLNTVVKGGAYLDRINAEGMLAFVSTQIDGQLSLNQAKLSNPEKYVLNARTAEIKGGVVLNRAEAVGGVTLVAAVIDGQLALNESKLSNPNNIALDADSAAIKGGLFMNHAETAGIVSLMGATIDGRLSLNEGKFKNPDDVALIANTADIKGGFSMERAEADGGVSLVGAAINDQLNLNESKLSNPNGIALDADSAVIKGGLFMIGAKAVGSVSLVGAMIDGQLFFNKTKLSNPSDIAFHAYTATVKGSVFMNGIEAEGRVSLSAAMIDGTVEICGAILNNPDDQALDMEGATIRGHVFCSEEITPGGATRPFVSIGAVNLVCATIDRDLNIQGATLISPKSGTYAGLAITARSLQLGGAAYLTPGEEPLFALGAINFFGAVVKSHIAGGGGVFVAPEALDISAHSEFQHCAIKLPDSDIGGDLFFGDAMLIGALDLDGSAVAGNVQLDDAAMLAPADAEEAEEERANSKKGVALSLLHAKITGALQIPHFSEPKFEPARNHPIATNHKNLCDKIETVIARQLTGPYGRKARGADAEFPHGCMDFRNAEIGHLDDRPYRSWPIEEGRVHLDGLTYGSIRTGREPDHADYQEMTFTEDYRENERLNQAAKSRAGDKDIYERRLAWLAHQFKGWPPEPKDFRPQPYEQLAKTLRAQGFNRDANMIAAEKRHLHRLAHEERNWQWRGDAGAAWDRFVAYIFEVTSMSGYSTGRAVSVHLLGFVIATIGAWLVAAQNGFQFTGDGAAPEGWRSVLALAAHTFDTYLPIINFGNGDDYVSASNTMAGLAAGAWRFATTIGGAILTGILALTFTGFTRRE